LLCSLLSRFGYLARIRDSAKRDLCVNHGAQQQLQSTVEMYRVQDSTCEQGNTADVADFR
jgi:hypothetical protein